MSKDNEVVEKDANKANPSGRVAYLDNKNINGLPDHLKQFIIDQNYNQYTPIDHAVWRYVMRRNLDYLKDHAHEAYVTGLQKTGIGIDKIPSIEQMNEILAEIGWAAVTVDGFIPPAAFMEFQAHRVLVIAADIRQLDHIEYTPAPDIIHEAAGHAPIIADPDYAEYLRRFGEYGSKAISSRSDYALYEAIRHLSILKEASKADESEIDKAEKLVAERQANLGVPSEMALLSRLHWWTVEYGLIGSTSSPRLYGAGLLSSIGESKTCLQDDVTKIDYDIDAQDLPFDITTRQPQLFVARSFAQLIEVLEQFAEAMAFRTGGLDAINKAIECTNTCTALYDSGLQVSGVLSDVLVHGSQAVHIKTSGPTALAYDGTQLDGHGRDYHADGFGSPIGLLKNGVDLSKADPSQLEQLGIVIASEVTLSFLSGIVVTGKLRSIESRNDKPILMTFDNCTVKHGDVILFDPGWGTYDMAVGSRIVSVFNGAADKNAFEQTSLVPRERTVQIISDESGKRLQSLYHQVRECRSNSDDTSDLDKVFDELKSNYRSDWLLSLEILELLVSFGNNSELQSKIEVYLRDRAASDKQVTALIEAGLELIG